MQRERTAERGGSTVREMEERGSVNLWPLLPKLCQTKPWLLNCTADRDVIQSHFKLLQLAKITHRRQAG